MNAVRSVVLRRERGNYRVGAFITGRPVGDLLLKHRGSHMSKPVSKTNPNLVDLIGDLKHSLARQAHLCGEMSHYVFLRVVVIGHNRTLAA